jgi:S-adenosylmethionine synthetase
MARRDGVGVRLITRKGNGFSVMIADTIAAVISNRVCRC